MSENTHTERSLEDAWAKPVDKLHAEQTSAEAINLVEGQELTGPIRGFGQMWQKTYTIPLNGAVVKPDEVIQEWKDNFPKFWPEGNRFFPTEAGITPGEVGIIHGEGPGGITGPPSMPIVSTGVMVIYSDDESFSFMTPEGHPFAAMITFSSFEEGETTMARVQALLRAYDPLAELIFRFGGSKQEDRFWEHTLRSVAAHFGVEGEVQTQAVKVDPRLQWSEAKNIVKNAGFRTIWYHVTRPFRWVVTRFSSGS
jgi:hypothetical protein